MIKNLINSLIFLSAVLFNIKNNGPKKLHVECKEPFDYVVKQCSLLVMETSPPIEVCTSRLFTNFFIHKN